MHKYNMGEYLYNNLPPMYQSEDVTVGHTLKRYLETLGVSFSDTMQDTVDLLQLIDVEKLPTRLLPYYGRMFGFEYDDSVPEEFQRKYLANIVNIFKRKGTKAVIRYTARELTGMNATVTEGHYLGFKTWSKDKPEGKTDEYIQPRTYGGKDRTSFYYLGGDNTSRYTITVTLTTDDTKGTDEIFLNTQLISRYTKELVQPYVNLRYRAYGILDSDDYNFDISKIKEGHSDYLLDNYNHSGKFAYSDNIFSRETYNYTHKPQNTYVPLDKVSFLTTPYDTIDPREVESEEGQTNIVDIHDFTVQLNVVDEESTIVTTKYVQTVAKPSVKVIERLALSEEDTRENSEVTYEDLGVTANRTSTYNEVLTLKSSYSKDGIHLNSDYDIMTLGNITEDYTDNLVCNYEFIGQQYAPQHEGIPNGLLDSDYNIGPSIPNVSRPSGWATFGHWVTTYLEKDLGEVDDNIGIQLRNSKVWGYNSSTDTWELIDEGFEAVGWREEIMIYEDQKSSISGTHKVTGSNNNSWGNTDEYTIRHRGTTQGYCGVINGHQFDTNYEYFIAQVDFRLTKYNANGYDSLDDARILVNVSTSWRQSADGICEHYWYEDKVCSFGRFIRATRDWRTAYTTNLPQNWSGSVPTELQQKKGEL